MKKKVFISIIVVVVFISGLSMLAFNPIISNKVDIPASYMEAIDGQAKGVYSKILPLVPVYVSVDGYSTGRVFYTIYYFPFGTVGMSYAEMDGYNIEKPLTNQ